MFPKGTATFTNGSKTVTSISMSAGDISAVARGSRLDLGTLSTPANIIEAVDRDISANTITLRDDFTGTTGTYSFVITYTSDGFRDAAEAMRDSNDALIEFVETADVNPNADTFAQRDSGGRVKTATPSASDDAVNLGYTGTAATYDVGTDSGDVMEVGAFGLGGDVTNITSGSLNDLAGTHTGFYHYGSAITDIPSSNGGRLINMVRSTGETTQIAIDNLTSSHGMYTRTANSSGVFGDWVEYYHSGNTSFNVFGGLGTRLIGVGYATSATQATIYLPINSTAVPSGITIPANSSFQIRTATGGILDQTLTESSITYNAASGERLVRLFVTASGMTANAMVELRSLDSTSKITVNF